MRSIRKTQYLFIFTLVVLDLIIQSFWSQLRVPFLFVSQMSFMGLLASVRNDLYTSYVPRFIVLTLVMDAFNYHSFPVYFLSYGISMMLVKVWYRHIGSSLFEWLVIMAIGLFVKEWVTYYVLVFAKGYIGSFYVFMASRSLWVILGNLVLFPIVQRIRLFYLGLLLKSTRRDYLEV